MEEDLYMGRRRAGDFIWRLRIDLSVLRSTAIGPSVSLRTRLLPTSATQILPAESTASPAGAFSEADFAGPPSPEKSGTPLPAIVRIMPSGPMMRMQLLPVSEI